MKTRQTRSVAALAGLPSTGGAAARGADDAHGRFAATAAGHPCPDAHGARPQSLWKVSGALWAGMGAALLSASLLLAASPAAAADKAGAKAAPIKAATRAAAATAVIGRRSSSTGTQCRPSGLSDADPGRRSRCPGG